MAFFTKKPITIEAILFTGDNYTELSIFTCDQFRALSRTRGEVFDITHEEWIPVKTGEWVARGYRGEFYPIDPEVLTDTYEKVTDG